MMLAEEQISRLLYEGCTEAVPIVYSPDGHDDLDWRRSMAVHPLSSGLSIELCIFRLCQGPDYSLGGTCLTYGNVITNTIAGSLARPALLF